MRRKTLKFAVLLVVLVFITIPLTAMASEVELTESEPATLHESFSAEELQRLENINPVFTTIPEVLKLKEQGLLDDLTAAIDEAYATNYASEMDNYLATLEGWDLTPEMTVSELADIAQVYLDNNYNQMQIESVEFQQLIKKMFLGDGYPLAKMAEDDPEFGTLYLYMCVYYDENFNEATADYINDATQPLTSETMGKTLFQVFEEDFNRNFQETTTMEILHEVEKNSLTRSGPENPLNGSSIQSYAKTWANSYNTAEYVTQGSDCTNFASQCLYAGGLAKTYQTSDKTADGYVDTTSRWFYFNDSSSSKYSASTSWVRVVDLYSYLSPNYAVFETSDGDTMSRYLNKGFLLQGKHLIGSYSHSVIVTKNSNNELCYCGHSSPRLDEPISTFYDGFSKYRVVQTY